MPIRFIGESRRAIIGGDLNTGDPGADDATIQHGL